MVLASREILHMNTEYFYFLSRGVFVYVHNLTACGLFYGGSPPPGCQPHICSED